MCNEWFFAWHHLERGMEVDDFNGGRIRYSGIDYKGSPQHVFWDAVGRYLQNKIAEGFVRIELLVAEERLDKTRELEWLSMKIREFKGKIVGRAIDLDARLTRRGAGGVPANAQRIHADANQTIDYLTEAVRVRSALSAPPLSAIYSWLVKHGIVITIVLTALGIVVAIIS